MRPSFQAAAAAGALLLCGQTARPPAAAIIPFRFVGSHIVAQVQLDRQGPFTVVIDTAGVNLMSPEVQHRLALRTTGEETGHGVGAHAVESGTTIVPLMAFGATQFHQLPFFVYPMNGIEATGGIRLDGIVGGDMFRRFVMQIDYGHGMIRLIDRRSFNAAAAGTAIPLTLNGNELYVPGSFDGLPGRFRIDTGSGSALDLEAPFVRMHQLAKKFSKRVYSSAAGFGGSSDTVMVRGKELKIGSVTVHDPVTGLSLATGGVFSGTSVAGNIGNAVLARFMVTIDFAGRRLYLLPSSSVPAYLDTFDRSGLQLRQDGQNFAVTGVMRPSPAYEAGVRAGDTILAIQGKPSRDFTLLGLRALLADRPVGTRVSLSLQRGHEHVKAAFELRNLL